MNMDFDSYIKLQYANLCLSMLHNINDNFCSVSFELLQNNDIQVKIILSQRTADEEELINDLIGELTATQETNNILSPIITTLRTEQTLSYLVYQLSEY